MKNIDFDPEAYKAFEEAALDKYDFARCQRPDGSIYGTGGTCRKGTPVGDDVGKKEKKTKAKAKGGGENKEAAGMAQEIIDDWELTGKDATAVKKDMQAAAKASIAGKPGDAIDSIDKVVDRVGGDMYMRENLLEEVGYMGKPMKITKDFSVTNLSLKDEYEAMDPEMKKEIRSAVNDFKKGKIDSQEMRDRLEEPATSLLAPIKVGNMKDAGTAGDNELELEELQLNRWHDAAYNSVDSGANSTFGSLGMIDL